MKDYAIYNRETGALVLQHLSATTKREALRTTVAKLGPSVKQSHLLALAYDKRRVLEPAYARYSRYCWNDQKSGAIVQVGQTMEGEPPFAVFTDDGKGNGDFIADFLSFYEACWTVDNHVNALDREGAKFGWTYNP